ncbi:MAG TPA: hypothetical protein VL285_01355 [Bryobacteraceae bacterium]|jgi:hypothetical protein|nr:hypothetical protein [Bryobacteraceae bacterium]
MQKIDPAEYRKRLDQLSEILTGIAVHAGELSKGRCPYKNKRDECTARFGCRNKRAALSGGLPICAGDDKLDYRGAWESGG